MTLLGGVALKGKGRVSVEDEEATSLQRNRERGVEELAQTVRTACARGKASLVARALFDGWLPGVCPERREEITRSNRVSIYADGDCALVLANGAA